MSLPIKLKQKERERERDRIAYINKIDKQRIQTEYRKERGPWFRSWLHASEAPTRETTSERTAGNVEKNKARSQKVNRPVCMEANEKQRKMLEGWEGTHGGKKKKRKGKCMKIIDCFHKVVHLGESLTITPSSDSAPRRLPRGAG